jgi:hypothetical protein
MAGVSYRWAEEMKSASPFLQHKRQPMYFSSVPRLGKAYVSFSSDAATEREPDRRLEEAKRGGV